MISYSLDLAEKLEPRSEEHTSELQSHSDLLLISLAFILFNFFRKKHLMKKIKIITIIAENIVGDLLER